jgi:hypothetical protein
MTVPVSSISKTSVTGDTPKRAAARGTMVDPYLEDGAKICVKECFFWACSMADATVSASLSPQFTWYTLEMPIGI